MIKEENLCQDAEQIEIDTEQRRRGKKRRRRKKFAKKGREKLF